MFVRECLCARVCVRACVCVFFRVVPSVVRFLVFRPCLHARDLRRGWLLRRTHTLVMTVDRARARHERTADMQIYPTLETLSYLKYFESPRYNNFVLAKYLSAMAVGACARACVRACLCTCMCLVLNWWLCVWRDELLRHH